MLQLDILMPMFTHGPDRPQLRLVTEAPLDPEAIGAHVPELNEEQDYHLSRLTDAGGYTYGEALEAVLGRDEHYGRVVELTLSDAGISEVIRSFVGESRAKQVVASAEAERLQREIAELEAAFNDTPDGAGFNPYMVRERAGLN